MLIDSHAHIYDEQFEQEGASARSIISGMRADGLEYIICVGCDEETARTCAELARNNDGIYAAIGVHPYDAHTVTPRLIGVLRELASSKKVVAIGEIGLDYHRPGSDRVRQMQAMIDQYELSLELELPTVYHIRDGFGDFYEFAKSREFPKSGVLHCFSGSQEIAEYYVKKGLYISFSGTLTYKNAVNLERAAKYVPLDRLLVETDSPYLSPEPRRGRTNYPKNVAYVCEKLAKIKGMPYERMEEITAENAKRVFGIG